MKEVIVIIFCLSCVIFALNFASDYLKETGADTSIYLSQDLAESFEKVIIESEPPAASFDTLAIEIDPHNSDVIYIGTKNKGLYRRDELGNWRRLEDPEGGLSKAANVYDIAIDSENSQRLYLAVYQQKKGRIFRSENRGESWQETYVVSQPKYAVFSIEVDNYEPNVVYAGTAEGGLLRSADYGRSWSIINWFDAAVSDIVINPKDTREIYVSAFEGGIYKTNNKGATWQSFKNQLEKFEEAKKVEKLAIDSLNPAVVYAASQYGILVSKNSGQSWQEMEIVMPPRPASSLYVEKRNPRHLYYGADSVLYQSLNGGETWKATEIAMSRVLKAIATDPQSSEVIYLGLGYD